MEKRFRGKRIRGRCDTTDVTEAQAILAKKIDEVRQALDFGKRPEYTFEKAAIKFVEENQHKRSLKDDVGRLRGLMPYIGALTIDKVNMSSLKKYIEARKQDGVAGNTINHGLQIVRHILNCAESWIDPNTDLTWIERAPKIKLLTKDQVNQISGVRKAYPLNWDEQDRLLRELPLHLREMALFAANTGCRDNEICALDWRWELPVKKLNTSIFVIPDTIVKNKMDRLVVLNATASEVVERQRGNHKTSVFVYDGKPITRMNNSAWRKARVRAGLPNLRVHDLKHTFGRRLRAAGVGLEDRQDLLGHKSQRITTHYSAAELDKLIAAANKVAEQTEGRPELLMMDRKAQGGAHILPTSKILISED